CMDYPRFGAEGIGARHRRGGAGTPEGGTRPPQRLDRQGPRRGQGSAHQGNWLLGPSRRGPEAAGAGRQDQRPPQLPGSAPPCGRSAGAASEAYGATRSRSTGLGAPVSALPPVALGGLVVLPAVLLALITGRV